MNSKTSSSNISIPLIRENIKRFWGIPVLAFIGYFITGTFPILIQYKEIDNISYMIEQLLSGTYPLYIMLLFIVPATTGLIVYHYMQTPGSTAIMHAMPFSRRSLFHSNFISGLILSLTPIVVNGIILLLIAKPTIKMAYENDIETAINVFTRTGVLKWVAIYLLISALFYAISAFSAVITGSSILQFLFSFGFIFLLPLLLLSFTLYCEEFIYGFTSPELFTNITESVSPIIQLLTGKFSTIDIIWYIFSFIAIYITSFYIYKKRKMEKTGDAITFAFLKPILKFIAAFIGMTGLGFFFKELSHGYVYMVAGLVFGAFLSYLVVDMIFQRSLKPKGFVKGFAIYAVVAALFCVSFMVDLTGYESRTPDLADVKEVVLAGQSTTYTTNYYEDEENKEVLTMTDPGTIEAVIGLHKMIAESKDEFMDNSFTEDVLSYPVNITYYLKNGTKMIRSYQVDYYFYSLNPYMTKIFDADEFKRISYPILAQDFNNIRSITMDAQNYSKNTRSVVLSDKAEMQEFATLFSQDIKNETLSEYTSLPTVVAQINFSKSKGKNKHYSDESYTLTRNYKLSIEWLKTHGYYDKLCLDASDYAYASVIKYVRSEDTESESRKNEVAEERTTKQNGELVIPESTDDTLIVSKADQIKTIFDKGQSYAINHQTYYEIRLYSDLYEDSWEYLYFDVSNAPEFITKYFE